MVLWMFALLAQDVSVDALIQNLGSDSVEEREEATARLHAIAERAEPELARAVTSSDSEVAGRAREILDALRPYRRRVAREMLHLFDLARLGFQAGRYDRALVFCEEMLRIDPRFEVALQLRRGTLLTILNEGRRPEVLRLFKEWRRMPGDAAGVAAVFKFSLPLRKEWESIHPEIHRDVAKRLEAWDEDGDVIAINRKLATMKIDLAFENAMLDDILAFIRDFSGLNIVVDATVADFVDPQRRMTFKVKDEALGEVLEKLLVEIGLGYAITEENVVLLTTLAKAGGRHQEVDRIPFNLDEPDPDRY